jgi:hypothetical protein
MAFFGYPRGHRVIPETRCLRHTGPNVFIDTLPRTERLKNPMATTRNSFQGWNGLLATEQALANLSCTPGGVLALDVQDVVLDLKRQLVRIMIGVPTSVRQPLNAAS